MDYEGIASVEFKYDEIDKCFKMVEINTRYWQQNYLSYISGVNFPLIDYAVSTGQKYSPVESYEIDRKWVNIPLSYSSYLDYSKLGKINFSSWLSDITGKASYSYFDPEDFVPFLIHIQRYLTKKFVSLIKGVP